MSKNKSKIDIFDVAITDYISDKIFGESKTEIKKETSCEECGKDTIIEDAQQGYFVCTNCGRIYDSILDTNPEWNIYDGGSNKDVGRCGKVINPLLPMSSIGTRVNAYGRIGRIQNWNSMPYKERSLNYVFKKLRTKCLENNIPKKIEDDAQIMYNIISKQKHVSGKNKGKCIITRGINRTSIIAATLFYACRRNGVTRSPKEIAMMFDLTETDLNRGAKNFLRLMGMTFPENDMGTSKPVDFVKRKCDELHIKSIYTAKAINIAENIDKLGLGGVHTSYSLAAACILLMIELNKLRSITKKRISDVFAISDVTISKAYKKISSYKKILINNKAVNKIVNKIKEDENKNIISKELYDRMKKFGINTDNYIIEDSNKVHTNGASKTNEIVILEESDDSDDEFDIKSHIQLINNSVSVLRKNTLLTSSYIDLIENIEDDLSYSTVLDAKIEEIAKNFMIKK